MATKTISLRLDAYQRLRRARRTPDESFSEVVLRAEWPDLALAAKELRARYDRDGPFLSEAERQRIEDACAADTPPEDKWRED